MPQLGSVGVCFRPNLPDRRHRGAKQEDPDKRAATAGEHLVAAGDQQRNQAQAPVENRPATIAKRRQRQLVLAAEHEHRPGNRGKEAHRDRRQDRVGDIATVGSKGHRQGKQHHDRGISQSPHREIVRPPPGAATDMGRSSYLLDITTMPTTTAARVTISANTPNTAAAPAASGRPSRLRSAKRAPPQIAAEKTAMTPTPATVEAITVSIRSLVWTSVAISQPARARPAAPGGRRSPPRAPAPST